MRYFLGIRPSNALLTSVERFRQRQGWHGMEPHITVKAPCGLNEQGEWLPVVRQLCQGISSPAIEISGIGTFGSATLFLRVTSPDLVALHYCLLRELHISAADQEACYEAAHYTPHLTLLHQPNQAVSSIEAEAAVANSFFPERVVFHAVELLVYSKREEGEYQVQEAIPFGSA